MDGFFRSLKRIELNAAIRYIDGMAHPLDLDLLRSFVTVVECRSLSAAAPRIGRSQSAVSMQIQRLEESVGRPLLVRHPRSVVPTPAGADFLVQARRLLHVSDEVWASVTQPEERGCVRLGVPDDYAGFLLPPILSHVAAHHPLVTVELVCEPSVRLVPAIAAGRIDLAIVTRLPEQPYPVLRREPLVWVASRAHEAWRRDPLPVALFEPGCAARSGVLHALGEAGRPYRCACFSAGLPGLVAAVQAGLAVAALARCSVPPSIDIIGEAEAMPPLDHLEFSLLRSHAADGAAVECMDDFLRANLALIAL